MSRVRPSALPCSRLRDSCVSCAMSKLRCSKTRPKCSRCEERAIDCQYFFARRPGRRREHGTGHSTSCTSRNNSSRSTPVPFVETGSSTTQSEGEGAIKEEKKPLHPTNSPGPTSDFQDKDGWTVYLPEDGDGTYSPHAFSVPGDFNLVPQLHDDEIDRLMAGGLTRPVPGSSTLTHALTSNTLLTSSEETEPGPSNANGTNSIPMELEPPEEPLDTSSIPTSPPPENAQSSNTTTTTPQFTCICVPRALSLLRTLSSINTSSTSSLPTTGAALYVLFQHKTNIEAVRRMLSCPPCTENSFLLAILSLAVLNILERYATALQRQTSADNEDGSSSSSASSTAAKRNCVDPDTVSKLAHSIISSGRVPSRVIVSELCRLQSLVNHLAPKVVHTSEALDSMEAVMRGALAVLAGEIMDRLKQY